VVDLTERLEQLNESFDIVAVQEVRKELDALDRLVSMLGRFWKYIVTDVTEGRRGNKERMAFLYDSRKVRHGGLAGELVLPPLEVNNEYRPVAQLARTPFICGFEAGWSRFMLATLHILYGKDLIEPPERIEEIRQVAQFLRRRTLDDTAWSRSLILLGDFNIYKPRHRTMGALEDAEFTVPDAIKALPSNVAQDKHYDQIAFRVQSDRLEPVRDGQGRWRAGVFDFTESVFKDEDEEVYIRRMGDDYYTDSKGKPRNEGERQEYYRTCWRTHQMSDHLPMWVELKINYSDRFLERKLAGEA